MMTKQRMGRIYVGDVGDITPPAQKITLPPLDLSALSFQQLCDLAVLAGFGLKDIIGVKSCGDHYGMVLLGDRPLPTGFKLYEHCSYCKNCFQLFRLKELPKE